MIQRNILTGGIFGLATLAGLLSSAHAAFTYNEGDIIVAFSGQPVPGGGAGHSGNTYLVDLGSVTNFQSGGIYATGNLITINPTTQANFVSDLNTATISTSTGVLGFFGSDGTFVFISRPETTAGTASTPVQNQNLDAPTVDIATVGFTVSGAGGAVNPNGAIQPTSTTNSYASYMFGPSSPTQAFEGNFGNPEGSLTPRKVLDLYQVTTGSGNAARLGAFDYNTTTGDLRFSSDVSDFAAVPEPSMASLCFAGLLAIGSLRLRMRRGSANS